jgi:hypothetical protein
METICSPERWFEREVHGSKTQKVSIVDATVNSSKKILFFDHKQYLSMERLNNCDSMVTRVWNPINLRKPEDGDDAFPETSVRTRATRLKTPEGIYSYNKQTPFRNDDSRSSGQKELRIL